MKHYIEIQRLRTQDVIVDDTLTLEKHGCIYTGRYNQYH